MIAAQEIKRLFHQLRQEYHANVSIDQRNIHVCILDNSSKLFFTTGVFNGTNYIPKSVRGCLNSSPTFLLQSKVKGYLTIDEEHHSISLNYIGLLGHLNNETFRDLLEDFSWLALQWQNYFDDHDRKDLIHVRVK